MGKGYTITRGVLSTQSTIVITVFFSAYTVCYAAVFIYEAEVIIVYFSYVYVVTSIKSNLSMWSPLLSQTCPCGHLY